MEKFDSHLGVFAYLIKTNGKHHLDTCKHSIIMVIDTKMKIACKLLSTVVILVYSFVRSFVRAVAMCMECFIMEFMSTGGLWMLRCDFSLWPS